jgi:anti-sigma regulatory factor (Ser/Thr protein kinase)
LELEIPARPSEVGAVRRAVRAQLVRYGLDTDHADIAQLVASELVMNAVLHGHQPIVVRLTVEPETTVVEVYDGFDTLPSDNPATDGQGRGLRVVAQLSADWGAVPAEGGGKTVWSALPHAPAPESSGMPRGRPKRRADDHAR